MLLKELGYGKVKKIKVEKYSTDLIYYYSSCEVYEFDNIKDIWKWLQKENNIPGNGLLEVQNTWLSNATCIHYREDKTGGLNHVLYTLNY